jgi:hypothetical protein
VKKFRAEIEDHAAQSRQKHIDAGMSPDEADRAALTGLGDAAQVALTFRDAHFSRGEYSRGWVAVIAFLALSIGTAVLNAIDNDPRWIGEPNPLGVWVSMLGIVNALFNGILIALIVRALVRLLKEQFDIEPPRWGWRLFVACLLIPILPGIIQPAVGWLEFYSPFARDFSFPANMYWLLNIGYMAAPASMFSNLVIGGLLVVFCVGQLAQPQIRFHQPLAVLLGFGGLLGLEMALFCVFTIWVSSATAYYLARAAAILSQTLAIPELIAGSLVLLGASAPLLALMLASMRMLGRMRQPGAVIAG